MWGGNLRDTSLDASKQIIWIGDGCIALEALPLGCDRSQALLVCMCVRVVYVCVVYVCVYVLCMYVCVVQNGSGMYGSVGLAGRKSKLKEGDTRIEIDRDKAVNP